MITTEKFFEAFDKAGFLKPALWTPSPGLPGAGVEQEAQVRFYGPTSTIEAGNAFATDPAIRYPASVFPDLQRGEILTVGGTQYAVREDPRSELDGSQRFALLSKEP